MATIRPVEVIDAIDPDRIVRLRAADEYFWLDLRRPSAGDLRTLAELCDLHKILVEGLEHFDQRPKLYESC